MGKKRWSVPIFLIMSEAVFFLIIVANVFLPLLQGKQSGLCIANLLVIGFWTYAFLGNIGIVKHIVSQDEDGNIEYDTIVPVIPVTIIRLVELGYFMLFKRINFEYKHFMILVILDVLFILFSYIYKGGYYYESRAEEDE